MPADQVFTCRLNRDMAAKVDAFAADFGVPRSTAMALLLACGLSLSKSDVLRSALSATFRALDSFADQPPTRGARR